MVASEVEVLQGEQFLYEAVRMAMEVDVRASPVDRFLAHAIADAAEREARNPAPLVVTTNYDDAMERAPVGERQEFDVITYTSGRLPPRSVPAGQASRRSTPPRRMRGFSPSRLGRRRGPGHL